MQGWVKYGSSCYLKINNILDFNSAQQDCIGRGGDLISLNSKDELSFFTSYTKNAESWVKVLSFDNHLNVFKAFFFSSELLHLKHLISSGLAIQRLNFRNMISFA
jgi:hypothetical protein